MWKVKWVVLWSLWATRVVRQPTPVVRTTSGLVRGSVAHSGTHAHYLGIPYATLQGRFQAPGPEPTWSKTFEAINENIRCTQPVSRKSTRTIGQEDCLILNIFTPTIRDKPLPVMVFIHGGGFNQHFSSRIVYGPEYLIPKGVILVTFNYRLNVQGFLCLGIKEAPGNAGMKDQVAAMRWIQKNIRAFGGDPDNVTIFGESAGGASVSYHVLSPMSKGLFHKAILQSGSSLASWAIQYEPVKSASSFAKVMGFESQDPYELYKFLMSKSDIDLVTNKIPRQVGTTFMSELIFVPCAETQIDGEDRFITDIPYNLLKTGHYNKVPMMMGASSQEGLLIMAVDDDSLVENFNFEHGLPVDLVFPSEKVKKSVAVKAKEMYMGSDEILIKNKNKMSKMYGEPHFNYPSLEETNLLMKSNKHPIYHYVFGYDGGRNIVKRLLKTDVPGATHIDELFYLFSQQILPSFYESEMINKMTTMWTNFAKYGNPTPSVSDLTPVLWPPVTPDNLQAFAIDHNFRTIPLWYNDTLLFWKEVYSKYRRKM